MRTRFVYILTQIIPPPVKRFRIRKTTDIYYLFHMRQNRDATKNGKRFACRFFSLLYCGRSLYLHDIIYKSVFYFEPKQCADVAFVYKKKAVGQVFRYGVFYYIRVVVEERAERVVVYRSR